jgi:hypothetical protein
LNYLPGLALNWTLLISASKVAKMTGVSYWKQTAEKVLKDR